MQWMLPEGVEEIRPPAGWRLEDLRRRLLDEFRLWGYELILPPLIEHADALLSGVGEELDLQTFRLTDQLSGRQLGVRADITPQAARLDARHLATIGVSRLCYLGTAIRARPDTPGGPRCLRQLGAELFGHDGLDSDREIIDLMLRALKLCGISDLHLDLGHVGIFRHLAADLSLSAEDEQRVFDLLQIKARDELAQWCRAQGLDEPRARSLSRLCELHGDSEVLAAADREYADRPAVLAAIDQLRQLHAGLSAAYPELGLHLDLGELRGYRYQTGVVFAAFVPGFGGELARGGRYNGIGASFGVDRPGTGFSADLNCLLQLGTVPPPATPALTAPAVDDPALHDLIRRLRAAGRPVRICFEPVETDIRRQDGEWRAPESQPAVNPK